MPLSLDQIEEREEREEDQTSISRREREVNTYGTGTKCY